ncbi:hypothetical protein V6N13_122280 [Hibiscus sabdariffa]|uniref:UvrD-like helicase ATP-binding domain-containing protein n=2 Tax=Hibiscus sabdariffa TaxID=183260 RepID=A0ABR2AMR6_9ROSI
MGFIDTVFQWSLEDIFNDDLYKDQVEKIPVSFQSVEQYFGSFLLPLLDETRAALCSSMEIIDRAPYAEVTNLNEVKPLGTLLFDVKVDYWRNRFSDHEKEPYKTLPGDVLIIADLKPENPSDLQRVGKTWFFALVTCVQNDDDEGESDNEGNSSSMSFKVKTLGDVVSKDDLRKSLYVVHVTNVTTNERIWSALHMMRNSTIINEVLNTDSVVAESCRLCSSEIGGNWNANFPTNLLSQLNESQKKSIVVCLNKMRCNHKSHVELIWGPPGTGKTKTVSVLLFALLGMKYRTLTCAPTDVAITEIASRVLNLVKEANKTCSVADDRFCSLADILLFGSKERNKVDSEIEEIFLDHRVNQLNECFGPLGWWHCFTSMVTFLEDCVPQYLIFLENESTKEREHENKEKECCNGTDCKKGTHKSFLEYARERFATTALPLRRCVSILRTHIPQIYFQGHSLEDLETLLGLLYSFETLLFLDGIVSEEVELVLHSDDQLLPQNLCDPYHSLCLIRSQCLSVLKALRDSLCERKLPSTMNKASIQQFCFQSASLLFSTACSSYELYNVEMKPLDVLVIDEAAQLKECESAIPMQLPGIVHSVLIGDEWQLPAAVLSNVSSEAGFGRSLFQRLTTLGHSKQLLNIQYRMHPSISCFPNAYFYNNQISDAVGVKHKSYEKPYLPWPLFGPYSFINVSGREEKNDSGSSFRNMVEVAVVQMLVQTLFKAWKSSRERLSVGIMSPYAAQVVAIQEKLGRKYERSDNFEVKVKSVDEFQGSVEDIIIISTVRSNRSGEIGFVSNSQRSNVALTRARHCLWVLGDGRTLAEHESVWQGLVHDAKTRHCFFDADEDKGLAKAIFDAKKEFDQLDDILNHDSVLFKNARWKVLFSDNFRKSFGKVKSAQTQKSVLNLLLRLSCGWRPKRNVNLICESSAMVLKQFKVESLYIVCSIDIEKEQWYTFTQVLKAWDLLQFEGIARLVKRLDDTFKIYTDDFICHCNEKYLEGGLEVPKTWPMSYDIVRYKTLCQGGTENCTSGSASDGRCYLEKSKVNESLLLMKFYSLSSGVVNHLLFDRDGSELELPFEVTEEERDIILFPRTTFVLARSGTGKTTVLTMKLFKQEQLHLLATEGFDELNNTNSSNSVLQVNRKKDSVEGTEATPLHQLFVTVNPRLCFAVKHHVLRLKRFISQGNFFEEGAFQDADDIDSAAEFKDIPDSFLAVLPKAYPLVITLRKFLIMLDGTIGNSFFEKFFDARELSNLEVGCAPTLVRNCIRTKEVNFEKFCSNYWPRFNAKLKKKLESSRVFTEIMSHIKGGLRSENSIDGILNEDDYVKLSEGRVSTLSSLERQMIYNIFQGYEKMKRENCEFDMADVVIDLHRRLQCERYEGDIMDFVYIDEVQDLTMRQIALFKHVCKNVSEGFVFCGDTAQTISKGIDFRFEDIRSLFYNEFVLGSKCETNHVKKEKGQISKCFHLSQNFRTHVGILMLAQSVIDLLYRFFPSFVDVLSPETSLINGEAPIWLESDCEDNVVAKMFADNGEGGGRMVGFGAEQVILVRDDRAKSEVLKYVGKQALVLTIVESKGLEFQDVLLYNFFGSSPLKNQWRVVYEYMMEQGLVDSTCQFPSFHHAKHHIMCSELKQLYVAITRTRQRLWICETDDEFSEPIFNYWKKSFLVQVRKLDVSLARAMQVASSPEEWKSRGYKLLDQQNYEMATTCFEKANDTYGVKLSEALGLGAYADRLHGSNPEMSSTSRRQAAEIFYSIGKAEQAAECYCMLKEYERAGQIYLEKCGEAALERAAECFVLAGCYKHAAEVYARLNYISKCLSACTKGKLFETGLQYIEYWKQHAEMVKRGEDLEKLKQKILESAAHHYHETNSKSKMMNYVRKFDSMNSRRIFLRSRECIDELITLEEESGNFLEAANLEMFKGDFVRAAEIFYSIGKSEEAAECFFKAKEYERAGRIYLEKCGEAGLVRAAECFVLAGCYKDAAELYARMNYLSKCISACTNGKLFEIGLQYIEYWKQQANMVKRGEYLQKLKQDILESAAQHYHEINRKSEMMNYVRAFGSMDSRRIFLRSKECLDELISLEEESGNLLEAADLLGKVSQFEQATHRILWFVLANSLWSDGSKGWPLKQFEEKGKLLTKAKSFAENSPDQLYELVCLEADILLNKPCNLSLMKEYLSASQRHNSTRGEILTARIILDHHLHLHISEYEWIDELVSDLASHSEEQMSNNQVSSETLVYFWNFWKNKILKVLEYLDHAKNQGGLNDYESYEDFCLNYFGVWRRFNNPTTVYVLLNSNAELLRLLDKKQVCRNQKQISISNHQFVLAARRYWCSELLAVGLQVLKVLEGLYNFSSTDSLSSFNRSRSLTQIYEVASFLLCSKFPSGQHVEMDLLKFVNLSSKDFFRYVFPLDWRESLSENMISLRGSETSRNLLEEVIWELTKSRSNNLSYGEIGNVALIIFGSGRLNTGLYGKILECLQLNAAWKNFIASLKEDRGSPTVSSTGCAAGHIKQIGNAEPVIFKFFEALQDAYEADWRNIFDYMSPDCFLYLVERCLMLLSFCNGYFLTTKTTFVEWFIYWDGTPSSTSSFEAVDQQSLEDILEFVLGMVQQLLYCDEGTVEWIEKSRINVEEYHSLLVLRLIIITCLVHLNFGKGLDLLADLLGQEHITGLLPSEFCDALRSYSRNIDINVLSDAFQKIGNPLAIVSMNGICPKYECKEAIFVDMKINPCKEEILRILFPKTESCHFQTAGEAFPPSGYDEGTSSEAVASSSSVTLPAQDSNTRNQ